MRSEEILKKKYVLPVFAALLEGATKKSDLSHIVTSSATLDKLLDDLKNFGFITIHEELSGRRTYKIELTDSGFKMALKARSLYGDSSLFPPSNSENSNSTLSMHVKDEIQKIQELRLLYHLNVFDDHVTIEEIPQGSGRSRIFNVYIRRNGHGDFRLWCEHDESFECVHAQVAWTYPQVQHMVVHYKGKTKICPSCGHENNEKANYCENCGAKLD